MAKEFTIGEVAVYTRIEASAIRYYESVGLIPHPKRVNGRRRYDLSVLKRIELINLARQVGFRIGELQVLFSTLDKTEANAPSWQTLARNKIAEMDILIQQTMAAKAWLTEALNTQCAEVGDCITITFDQEGNNMGVVLACKDLRLK